MIRLTNLPEQHLEIIHGKVIDFELSNDGGIWLILSLRHSNIQLETDEFFINLNNIYDYKRFIASIGTYCPINDNLMLDINVLVGRNIILTYLIGYGFRGQYRNFHSLVVVNEMITHSYFEDEEN